jgi:hypothetical protein
MQDGLLAGLILVDGNALANEVAPESHQKEKQQWKLS